jgi:UDP-GlcNAc:undecaprenyl-phosphate/decaprenyl-phosphate GlcNAc-1-phosphate transferase
VQELGYLITFVTALAVSLTVMPGVIRLAERIGAMDHPGGRRVHRAPIPRLGGIGIVAGSAAGIAAGLLLTGRAFRLADSAHGFAWLGVAIGTGIIFVAGTLDDIYQFRPPVKFLFQLVAAAVAVSTGVETTTLTLPGVGVVELGAFYFVFTVAWIVLVTNAMNLIDGLDGLAGGLSLIVIASIGSLAFLNGRFGVLVCAAALAGALLGFLRYNFSPARIFMGDGGSQFLGFTLALISVRGSQKSTTTVAIIVPLMIMGLPLLDLATSIARRARRDSGERGTVPLRFLRRISRADRGHVHHNLLDLGLSPARAVFALYVIGSLFALSGYLAMVQNSLAAAVLTLCFSIGSVGVIKLVAMLLRRRDHGGSSGRTAAGTSSALTNRPT